MNDVAFTQKICNDHRLTVLIVLVLRRNKNNSRKEKTTGTSTV
jgi:hypothetical protein